METGTLAIVGPWKHRWRFDSARKCDILQNAHKLWPVLLQWDWVER